MSTHTWSVTAGSNTTVRCVSGASTDTDAARRQAIATVATMAQSGGHGSDLPRYELHIDGQPMAVIQVGHDEYGRPDHGAVPDLLGRVDEADPFLP